jgi:hypothetical protein
VYFSEASTNEQGQVTRDYNYELDTGYEGVQNAYSSVFMDSSNEVSEERY